MLEDKILDRITEVLSPSQDNISKVVGSEPKKLEEEEYVLERKIKGSRIRIINPMFS